MTVDEHIKILEEHLKGSIPYDKMISAVDELRKPEEIQKYFCAYVKIIREHIKSEHKKDTLTGSAFKHLQKGKSYDEVARLLAQDQMSYLLNKFNNPKVHKAWSDAIPSLYPKGKLRNMLETYLDE